MLRRKNRSTRIWTWTGLFMLALALMVGIGLSASGVFAGAPPARSLPLRVAQEPVLSTSEGSGATARLVSPVGASACCALGAAIVPNTTDGFSPADTPTPTPTCPPVLINVGRGQPGKVGV